MKKLLGILVLGLLWCNVGFAGVMEWKCSSQRYNYANFKLDKENKILISNWQLRGEAPVSATSKIISMDNQKLEAMYSTGGRYTWYYGTDQHMEGVGDNEGFSEPFNCEREREQKLKFASKEKQYEHTCGKALGLKKGSKRFLECALKIMEMELELTKLQAEKEVALARAETAMANQQMEKVTELNAIANAKSQKFKNNVGNLLLGLLVLGEINSASQQANSFKKVFTCSSTGFATGTQYAVNCY